MYAAAATPAPPVDSLRPTAERDRWPTSRRGVGLPWQRRHFAMMAGIGLLLGILRAEAAIDDTDSLWSARFGLDFLSSGHLPRTDPYSWTAADRSWIPNSWGWNVLLGLGYRLDGMSGIWIVGTIVAVALGLLVAHVSARIGAAPFPTAIVFAVLGMLALVASPRAQTVSNLIVLGLPLLLPPILFGSSRQALHACAVAAGLQALWMNLHTAAILGPAVLGVAGAGLLVANAHRGAELRREVARLVGVVVLTAICCLATPYGAAPLLHLEEVRRASVGLISEWDHPGFGNGAQIIGLAMIAVAVAAMWPAYRGRRFATVGLLALFALATASAIRFAPMIAVFAMPELAVVMSRRRVRPFFVAAACATLATFAAMNLGSFARFSTNVASPSLVAALPHGCTLVNDYALGGVVILLRTDIRVSVDGRNDMYGRARILSAVGMLKDAPGTIARMDAAGVTCVLTTSGDKLVQQLSRSPKWHVVGQDGVRTLLVHMGYQP